MEKIIELKKVYSTICEFLDKVESINGAPEVGGSLKELFTVEIHSFFMYLSSADGKITSEEKNFMNILFGTEMSIQDYIRFINENDIYSIDFEERLPLSLKITALFDAKMIIAASLRNQDYTGIAPKIIEFYLEAGKRFIACDGDVDDQEVEDLKTIIRNMTEQLQALLEEIKNKKGEIDEEDDKEVGFIGGKKGLSKKSSNTSAVSSTVTKYGPSIYKVGVDIPAGKYKLFAPDARAYYAVCTDANCNNIVQNDNFCNQAYIDIYNGQFVELCRCYAVPLTEASMYSGTEYSDGEYIVGKEIPVGEFKAIANLGQSGYYSLDTFAGDGSRDIYANNVFSNAAYIETRRGQILTLCRCTIII